MIRVLPVLLAAAAACAADAWVPAPGIAVQPDGRIQIGGATLALVHYDEGWKNSFAEKAVEAKGAVANGVWTREGAWKTEAASGRLTQTLKLVDGRLHLEAQLADAGPTKLFCLAAALPGDRFRGKAVTVDGVAVALPAESPQPGLHTGKARLVEIPLPSGQTLEFSGTLSVYVQDNKKWGNDSFAVRIVAGADQRVDADLRLKP